VRFPRATRLVICCRHSALPVMEEMRSIMRKLKLTVNEEKTHICRLPDESFDFLGYTFGRCYSPKTGYRFIGQRPSRKKVQAICKQISELTSRRWLLLSEDDQVARLNRSVSGWANYFYLGPVSKAYQTIDQHTRRRLRRWLCEKRKQKSRGYARYPNEYLYAELGLTQLACRTRNFP
jgi:hypothetical protein